MALGLSNFHKIFQMLLLLEIMVVCRLNFRCFFNPINHQRYLYPHLKAKN
jgi:hypothetical protein